MATDKEVQRDLVDKRVAAYADELAAGMSRSLYADAAPRPQIGLEYYVGYIGNETCQNITLTWRQWFAMMGSRIRDAWLVLRGKAEIE